MYLGSWKIDDAVTFPAVTHHPTGGSAVAADTNPTWYVYEDNASPNIASGTMLPLNSDVITGLYSAQINLNSSSGFEQGKTYTIAITASVASTTGNMAHIFQIGAEVQTACVPNALANRISDHILRRSASAAEASSDGDPVHFRSLLGAVSKQVNRFDASDGTAASVFQTDDTTVLGTQTITACDSASPIVQLNTD